MKAVANTNGFVITTGLASMYFCVSKWSLENTEKNLQRKEDTSRGITSHIA